MWKYRTVLSYLGTDFCGWQKQKQHPTSVPLKPSIQGTLEHALTSITGEKVGWVGSGRTDSGVHASAQVAHFVLKAKEWDENILMKALNSLLPRSIQVISLQKVDMSFHAQKSAIQKQYSYYFQQGPCALPHLEPLSWWIRKNLNLASMNEAIQALIGEHDFKPFQAAGAKPGPTVRRILEATVTFEPIPFPMGILGHPGPSSALGLVRVKIIGTGFLKQMVRSIAGTLLQVAEERRSPSCFVEILHRCDRNLVGPTAPGRALWLERVWYPGEG